MYVAFMYSVHLREISQAQELTLPQTERQKYNPNAFLSKDKLKNENSIKGVQGFH